MSVTTTQTAPSTTLTVLDRTWRITIETPYAPAASATPPAPSTSAVPSPSPPPYTVSIHREKLTFDSNGNQIGNGVREAGIVVPVAALATQSFTAGGVTVTGAQLAALIEAAGDAITTADNE